MKKDEWKKLFLPANKKMRSNMLLALLVGIMLLTAGKGLVKEEGEPERGKTAAENNIDQKTEQRMAEILSAVAGAGMVDVMLTYRQSGEKTIAHNETREEDGACVRTEQTVILLEDTGGATQPVILKEDGPVVEGVLITAQGADQPGVAAALNQAAQALLDVPAHKVAVLKMK